MRTVRTRVIRAFLKAITFGLPVLEPLKTPISYSKAFLVFSHPPRDHQLQKNLAMAYQAVFSAPPWNEDWPMEKVLTKLHREVANNSFLVLMIGNKEPPIGGFCWGAITSMNTMRERIRMALGIETAGLEALHNRGLTQILYFDEFATLPQFRGGLDPIRFLMRPGFDLGHRHRVYQTLFWSTPNSRIVPLALFMGYEIVLKTHVDGKRIVFLYNPDFRPLMKLAQYVPSRLAIHIMRITSKMG